MKKILLLFIVVICSINSVFSQNEFITTWETTTPNETITIPTLGTGYNYDIDWENDSAFDDIGVTGNITHTYTTPGIYTVVIRGVFPRIYFNNSGDKNKIKSIDQWGDIVWTSFSRAFFGCNNLIINASDAPDLSNVTDLSLMFWRCSSFNQSIDHWDTSNVTNLSGMFSETPYNQSLNSWDVSNILIMSNLFNGATSFNQPINNWDVSNVTTMTYMFNGCFAFNQSIDNWNVSSVNDMSFMFAYATLFNQPLNNWDVSSVINMWNMFVSTPFNQSLNNWDVSSVAVMTGMFESAISFNQPIDSWNVGSVTDMQYMFINAQSFNQPLNSWNVSSAIDMNRMFELATSFNRRLGAWNVSNVTNMTSMFQGATSFNLPMENWNVSSVTNMSNMFDGAIAYDQSIGSWNVSNVTDMTNMFLNVTLSEANYDALLIGWEAQTLLPNVSFHGGFSKYCNAATERANIISTYGWSITDGGQATCSLSINNEELQNITFYPNPTNGSFSIRTNNNDINKVEIYDVQGKTVKTFTENSSSYNIKELTTGLYFIKIETDKGVTTKKMMKE